MIRLKQAVAAPDNVQGFDLTDRGLLLADGVFNTSRVIAGRAILWDRHLERLCGDAAALGIVVSRADIEALVRETVPAHGDGALRVTVTRGPGGRGLSGAIAGSSTLIGRFTPMDLPYPAPPVRLTVSDIRRNPSSPTNRHKTLAYTDNIMALRAAQAAGFDDALFLSGEGQVACASAANLFALFGGRLVTPPVADGALPGVLRGWLMEAGADAGLDVVAETLALDQLLDADCIFLTNSLRVFQPVTEIDGRSFGGRLPERLLELGRALLGEGESND